MKREIRSGIIYLIITIGVLTILEGIVLFILL